MLAQSTELCRCAPLYYTKLETRERVLPAVSVPDCTGTITLTFHTQNTVCSLFSNLKLPIADQNRLNSPDSHIIRSSRSTGIKLGRSFKSYSQLSKINAPSFIDNLTFSPISLFSDKISKHGV